MKEYEDKKNVFMFLKGIVHVWDSKRDFRTMLTSKYKILIARVKEVSAKA